ncbi:phasin family protein [Methylocystis parvus]|uniref:Phasin family protein n=1 Tax=Methylocystis parvus TaxID=134 RepID=A0A6B8MB25_9HYPH|nr:phasin family protein [Methylocystis parvus]QGM98789.1 phasin family protein [Methylocystis parvus]WBK00861.1 phasin family protein [Methylocystis parvus OBBP]
MVANFESVQQLGKEQFEAVSAAAAAVTKGWQSIAAETTDYSKKSFEKSRLLAEKLIAVKKIDEAFALQSDFAKSAYEDFVAEATKIGELYTSMTKEVLKPIETATKTFTAAAE